MYKQQKEKWIKLIGLNISRSKSTLFLSNIKLSTETADDENVKLHSFNPLLCWSWYKLAMESFKKRFVCLLLSYQTVFWNLKKTRFLNYSRGTYIWFACSWRSSLQNQLKVISLKKNMLRNQILTFLRSSGLLHVCKNFYLLGDLHVR